MTSTNDGKDVKSIQTSGPKGKKYYIELYKSLEAALNQTLPLPERTEALCDTWGHVYSLCLHSAPSTHPHLLTWIQRHTSRTLLQTEWQTSEEQRKRLEDALLSFLEESVTASGADWARVLRERAEWYKTILSDPWGHPVLRQLIQQEGGTQPTEEEVLQWLKEERGVMFATRLRQLSASKGCAELALLLTEAVMKRARAERTYTDEDEDGPEPKDPPPKEGSFVEALKQEAGFTSDVWELLTDLELVLLHRRSPSGCIDLAKQIPLRASYTCIERLRTRLESAPHEKKIWKNARDVATLVAQVVIARCMVRPMCAARVRAALFLCGKALVRLVPTGALRSATAALAAPAATAKHLHTLAAAVEAQLGEDMKGLVCELYVRAITAGMNELERLKLQPAKEAEARSAEQTLSLWFSNLAQTLSPSPRLRSECLLTAFSVHPARATMDLLRDCATPNIEPKQEEQEPPTTPASEFGSWANDSCSTTNLVKTSQSLNMALSQPATGLSTCVLAEGERLGLATELCQDLASVLSGPRLKTLSWDMDRAALLESCRVHMDRTAAGTRGLTTELKFLNLDPKEYLHLPEEEDGENDLYYGIEKGYEHLVELTAEPEEIWADAQDSDSEPERTPRRRRRAPTHDEDPLSLHEQDDKPKKERDKPTDDKPKKERDKNKTPKAKKTTLNKDGSVRKQRSVLLKPVGQPSLASLIGMKVSSYSDNFTDIQDPQKVYKRKDKPKKERRKKNKVVDAAAMQTAVVTSLVVMSPVVTSPVVTSKVVTSTVETSPGASVPTASVVSPTRSESNVQYDGLFSMDDMLSPPRAINVPNESDIPPRNVKKKIYNLLNYRKQFKSPSSSPCNVTSPLKHAQSLEHVQNLAYSTINKMPQIYGDVKQGVQTPSVVRSMLPYDNTATKTTDYNVKAGSASADIGSRPNVSNVTNHVASVLKTNEPKIAYKVPPIGAKTKNILPQYNNVQQTADETEQSYQNIKNMKAFLSELRVSLNAGTNDSIKMHTQSSPGNMVKVLRKVDNAPNTFSRLSYMHKNKVETKNAEEKPMTQREAISLEVEKTIKEMQESKRNQSSTAVEANAHNVSNLLRTSVQTTDNVIPKTSSYQRHFSDQQELMNLWIQKNKMTGNITSECTSKQYAQNLTNISGIQKSSHFHDAYLREATQPSIVTEPSSTPNAFSPSHMQTNTDRTGQIESTTAKHKTQNQQPDWETVLNSIRAHKTPSRGPNALDMALKKAISAPDMTKLKVLKPQKTTNTAEGAEVKKKSSYVRKKVACSRTTCYERKTSKKPLSADLQCSAVIQSNPDLVITHKKTNQRKQTQNVLQTLIRPNKTVLQTVIKPKGLSNCVNVKTPGETKTSSKVKILKVQNFPASMMRSPVEIKAKGQQSSASINKTPKVINTRTSEDLDLLDELIDKELLEEIGELTSDEEASQKSAKHNIIGQRVKNMVVKSPVVQPRITKPECLNTPKPQTLANTLRTQDPHVMRLVENTNVLLSIPETDPVLFNSSVVYNPPRVHAQGMLPSPAISNVVLIRPRAVPDFTEIPNQYISVNSAQNLFYNPPVYKDPNVVIVRNLVPNTVQTNANAEIRTTKAIHVSQETIVTDFPIVQNTIQTSPNDSIKQRLPVYNLPSQREFVSKTSESINRIESNRQTFFIQNDDTQCTNTNSQQNDLLKTSRQSNVSLLKDNKVNQMINSAKPEMVVEETRSCLDKIIDEITKKKDDQEKQKLVNENAKENAAEEQCRRILLRSSNKLKISESSEVTKKTKARLKPQKTKIEEPKDKDTEKTKNNKTDKDCTISSKITSKRVVQKKATRKPSKLEIENKQQNDDLNSEAIDYEDLIGVGFSHKVMTATGSQPQKEEMKPIETIDFEQELVGARIHKVVKDYEDIGVISDDEILKLASDDLPCDPSEPSSPVIVRPNELYESEKLSEQNSPEIASIKDLITTEPSSPVITSMKKVFFDATAAVEPNYEQSKCEPVNTHSQTEVKVVTESQKESNMVQNDLCEITPSQEKSDKEPNKASAPVEGQTNVFSILEQQIIVAQEPNTIKTDQIEVNSKSEMLGSIHEDTIYHTNIDERKIECVTHKDTIGSEKPDSNEHRILQGTSCNEKNENEFDDKPNEHKKDSRHIKTKQFVSEQEAVIADIIEDIADSDSTPPHEPVKEPNSKSLKDSLDNNKASQGKTADDLVSETKEIKEVISAGLLTSDIAHLTSKLDTTKPNTAKNIGDKSIEVTVDHMPPKELKSGNTEVSTKSTLKSTLPTETKQTGIVTPFANKKFNDFTNYIRIEKVKVFRNSTGKMVKNVKIKRLSTNSLFWVTVNRDVDVGLMFNNPQVQRFIMNHAGKDDDLFQKNIQILVNLNRDGPYEGEANGFASTPRRIVKETINLISDDEEEPKTDVGLKIDQGYFKIRLIDAELLDKHKKKLRSICFVPLTRCPEPKQADVKTEDILQRAKDNINNVDELVNALVNEVLAPEIPKVIEPALGESKLGNESQKVAAIVIPEVIELDDSSNEGVESLLPEQPEVSVTAVEQLEPQIIELTNRLLSDLGVTDLTKPEEIIIADDLTSDCESVKDQVATKKCFVRLEPCDEIVEKYRSASEAIIAADSTAADILQDFEVPNSDSSDDLLDICELDTSERCDSPSILNATLIMQNAANVETGRTSPVIAVYDILASLMSKNTVDKSLQIACRTKCESEWLETKKLLHGISLESVSNVSHTNLPTLMSMILNIIENSNVIDKMKPISTSSQTLKQRSLKRERDTTSDWESMTTTHMSNNKTLKRSKKENDVAPITPDLVQTGTKTASEEQCMNQKDISIILLDLENVMLNAEGELETANTKTSKRDENVKQNNVAANTPEMTEIVTKAPCEERCVNEENDSMDLHDSENVKIKAERESETTENVESNTVENNEREITENINVTSTEKNRKISEIQENIDLSSTGKIDLEVSVDSDCVDNIVTKDTIKTNETAELEVKLNEIELVVKEPLVNVKLKSTADLNKKILIPLDTTKEIGSENPTALTEGTKLKTQTCKTQEFSCIENNTKCEVEERRCEIIPENESNEDQTIENQNHDTDNKSVHERNTKLSLQLDSIEKSGGIKTSTPTPEEDQGIILKGIEYQHPIIGTCYIFSPIADSSSETDSYRTCADSPVIGSDIMNNTYGTDEPQSIYEDSNESSANLSFTTNAAEIVESVESPLGDFEYEFVEPKRTYGRKSLKRKIGMLDVKLPEKYRKGKNIDYPKISVSTMSQLAYAKEFNAILKYAQAVQFSFTTYFLKDLVDVQNAVTNWPIAAVIAEAEIQSEKCEDCPLFTEPKIEDESQKDPLKQTLQQELSPNCLETEIPCSEKGETNLNMGFGEGSGRVIKKIIGGGHSKFSAATLSDVKHAQPFLLSETKDNRDVVKNVRRYLSCVKQREKVRSFFEKSKIELGSAAVEKKPEKDAWSVLRKVPGLHSAEFLTPPPLIRLVNVVQVGQQNCAAAQNPVTCDPRVTQVSDASPSQCSVDNNSPGSDNNQTNLKNEYTELTTADLSFQSLKSQVSESQPESNPNQQNIPQEVNRSNNTDRITTEKETNNIQHNRSNNIDYHFDANNSSYDASNTSFEANHTMKTALENGQDKTDQIAHAMTAAGISETEPNRPHPIIGLLSKTIHNSEVNEHNTNESFTQQKQNASINAMALQQALAQILPPPLNQTVSNENQESHVPQHTPVLHIVQGKNAAGNPITLVDSSQQSVIGQNVLHIVQQNSNNQGQTSNGTPSQNFSGLSLVDAGLQQGGNQLLHIVNTGNQKAAQAAGQILKRVNLLTNLANVQGNEQKMVQFVCKSADGKSIHLNAPHQRSMVLRLQPIETPVQHPQQQQQQQQQKPTDQPDGSQEDIKSRSIYEENYAKFIQTGTPTSTASSEKSTSLPKFNQAFGKPVFEEGNQKDDELNNELSMNDDGTLCTPAETSINIDHMNQISSPPLLLRKTTTNAQTPQSIIQQIKNTITPMNIQTMHGGVIYTRQIPVNIGGGQTINLITVPTTELVDEAGQKQQKEMEPSIIKIVPQANSENQEESGTETPAQQQPVLTQMRIKLPMLSKSPQVVPGARVVRPSFFQIQRNVVGGGSQPVYQQLVLTAAPPLGQQTIRLPQAPVRTVKPMSETPSPSESELSSSTLEQLREFDMVLEQVKERSIQPSTPNSAHTPSTTDSTSNSSQNENLYSIGTNQTVTFVRKSSVTTPTTSTFVRSPDSTGIVDSPSSASIPQTVTEASGDNCQSKPKISSKSIKSKPKTSSHTPSALKVNHNIPPKTSTQKPLEDEQTTQRILYILAEYKEQVENSPDKDKPAPRRRSNPPANPGGSSKRKKSSGSRRPGCTRDHSPIMGDDACRTMGSEDSSCGTSQGDCSESCNIDAQSPQDSPRKVVRKLTFEPETPIVTPPRTTPTVPPRNVIVADGQTITVARSTTGKPTTAVLMPANYILPVSMVKGGQQIAIVTNRGPKLLTVGGTAGEGGATTNALLLQRLIGPAGLKPMLARPGIRHVRLPTAALHNLQAFNLAATPNLAGQNPDSTASQASGTNPDVVESKATSSPWTEDAEVKPEASPKNPEPWNLRSSSENHEYTYEEPVTSRSENVDRTVLVVHKKDGSGVGLHRMLSAAQLRHKYAILEQELRLQKSLSEECEDLGVDSPSASELFPEAELLFAASPAHDHHHEHAAAPVTTSGGNAQPQQLLTQHPQPDIDDQIASDNFSNIPHQPTNSNINMATNMEGLSDVGLVSVGEDGNATIEIDQEEFARSHPNTTFHQEPPSEDTAVRVQPYAISSNLKPHIASTLFHSTPTVLVNAPPTVIAQGAVPNAKYSGLDAIINQLPPKEDGLTRYDLLSDRELHLTNSSNATQVIRRVCYEDKRDGFFDEPDNVIAGDDAKMSVAEDSSRDATLESMDVDDRSSPERHAELFWESNSASERSEGRRQLDFSSDSEKCCKSPSLDDSTDSSGVGTHMRLDSVIKEARGRERSGSADGSSADDSHPPIRTYPAKRTFHSEERSLSGKTRAGESGESEGCVDRGEVRRRASVRGVVKRGCHCCNGSPAPPRPKKPRQRKPTLDFSNSN